MGTTPITQGWGSIEEEGIERIEEMEDLEVYCEIEFPRYIPIKSYYMTAYIYVEKEGQ